MSRSILRVLPGALVLSALACASPTAPTATRPQSLAPGIGASFDDATPTDTTCRSGYITAQGYTC